jgi:hypothetical protein
MQHPQQQTVCQFSRRYLTIDAATLSSMFRQEISGFIEYVQYDVRFVFLCKFSRPVLEMLNFVDIGQNSSRIRVWKGALICDDLDLRCIRSSILRSKRWLCP